MNFKEKYPQYAPIAHHIHAARLERAVFLSEAIVAAVQTVVAGLKRIGSFAAGNIEAERDRRSIEADAFLKRSVPRY